MIRLLVEFKLDAENARDGEKILDANIREDDDRLLGYEVSQLDEPDLDHLTDLYVQRGRALRSGDKYEAGIAIGRILEYAAQNALSNLDLLPAVEAAHERLYGHGPSTGAQC